MNSFVNLVKLAVENYIKKGKIISPPKNLPEEFFKRKAGAFVTIEKKENGKSILRGCIGTYLPTRINVAEEVIHNAVAAATEDYRFNPLQEEELSQLSYVVYILSYPKPVRDLKELNPKKFGLIVKTAPFAYPDENVVFNGQTPFKSGLLLPDLPGVNTAEKQFHIACQKGRIDPLVEQTFIYKFSVEKYQ